MRAATPILIAVTALALAACSDSGPSQRNNVNTTNTVNSTNSTNSTNDGGPPVGKELTFVKKPLDNNNAGEFTAIGAEGNRVGIAYYRVLSNDQWPSVECPATFSGGGGQKARRGLDLMYVESSDGGANWGTPVKVDQTINAAFGLSLTMGGGTVYLGYLGGAEANLSLQECQSSDAVIASSSDGQSWSTQTVFVQGSVGDSVGHWMSVALDSTGQIHSAYRDVGFGLYEDIGDRKSDLRYDTGGEGVDEDRGAGIFTTLLFTPDDKAAIMHFNGTQTDAFGGLQLALQQGPGTWKTKQLVAGGTAERPDFDTDGKGHYGISFYDPDPARALKYIESSDLETWTQPITVDLSSSQNGEFTSLAFDSAGNPAISYYRCGPVGTGSSCDSIEDGLMFAYRIDGKWKTYEVDKGDVYKCGNQTSLTFNAANEPVISYRCATLKNSDNTTPDTVKVARGIWK